MGTRTLGNEEGYDVQNSEFKHARSSGPAIMFFKVMKVLGFRLRVQYLAVLNNAKVVSSNRFTTKGFETCCRTTRLSYRGASVD